MFTHTIVSFFVWVIILLQSSQHIDGISWLSIASPSFDYSHIVRTSTDCDRLVGLSRRQALVCARNIELMDSVRHGVRGAIAECQHQFRQDRWNCPAVNNFTKISESGTREGAFLHAISSAGIAYSVTRACSSGQLAGCGCDLTVGDNKNKGIEWSGCSDNIDFGVAFSQNFVDPADRQQLLQGQYDDAVWQRANLKKERLVSARGRPTKLRTAAAARTRLELSREKKAAVSLEKKLLTVHNNNAGLMMLETSRNIKCKCHGVSGSCEIKTCFKTLPVFRQISDSLRASYDSATKVHVVHTEARTVLLPVPSSTDDSPVHVISTDKTIETVLPSNPLPKETVLVYKTESPSYCEKDAQTESLGTQGRLCNATSRGQDGCEEMCCGRGYLTRVKVVREKCHCKFQYCCYVKCEMCEKDIEEYICR